MYELDDWDDEADAEDQRMYDAEQKKMITDEKIKKLREALEDARRQIQMMGERMPLHLMTAGDSEMISIITHALEETKI